MASAGDPQANLAAAAADNSLDFDDDDGDFDGNEGSSTLDTLGRRRLFTKELRCMLFGYGDDANPYT
jgi:transcription initiation factor TFIID subunit 13